MQLFTVRVYQAGSLKVKQNMRFVFEFAERDAEKVWVWAKINSVIAFNSFGEFLHAMIQQSLKHVCYNRIHVYPRIVCPCPYGQICTWTVHELFLWIESFSMNNLSRITKRCRSWINLKQHRVNKVGLMFLSFVPRNYNLHNSWNMCDLLWFEKPLVILYRLTLK